MKPQANDRPLPVYEIPPHELAYYDAMDNRVTCDGCRNRADIWCRAGDKRTTYPPNLKHRCDEWRKAR